jgi:uncharacterized protein YndB with AHSA1/START domain
MTRARAFKQSIRARAARTGERYTTARRSLLKIASSRVAPAALAAPAPAAPVAPAARRAPGPAATPAKGAISDARVREKTGHGLDEWFVLLDRFGGVAKGHSALARHLHDAHGVDGWYSQGITVSYERARGVRAVNQRCDGDFEVSVSKVMTADAASVIAAFTVARRRRQWIGGADPALAKALAAAVAAKTSTGFVVRPDGLGRFRYKWDGTTVQFYLQPKAGGKVSLVVQHTKLANADAVEQRRVEWKQAFAALAAYLAA